MQGNMNVKLIKNFDADVYWKFGAREE